MLKDDLTGRAYNKAMNNRSLHQSLGRSKGSIEFKNCNTSAALVGPLGLPHIIGYQPRFQGLQRCHWRRAVSRWARDEPIVEASSATAIAQGFADTPPLFFGVPPTHEERSSSGRTVTT